MNEQSSNLQAVTIDHGTHSSMVEASGQAAVALWSESNIHPQEQRSCRPHSSALLQRTLSGPDLTYEWTRGSGGMRPVMVTPALG
jgi:hypothetical protein